MSALLALINTSRVLSDLNTLRSFGATGGGMHGMGVSRPALSAADLASREWLGGRFREAGLRNVGMDGLGTVHGTGGDDSMPALLMGSHSDTQPEGGWLDGALGVIYALEAARVLHEGRVHGAWAVADWQDEEGRFGTLTGSNAFAGGSVAWDRPCSRSGSLTLSEAATAAQLDALPVITWRDRAAGYSGYLEAHIEQGPLLERRNASLGVVSAIVGQVELLIRCVGEQNHAGTTRMADRKDGTLRAMRLATALDDALMGTCTAYHGGGACTSAVWTFSRLEGFKSHSTIPGVGSLTMQMRSPSAQLLENMVALVSSTVSTSNAAPRSVPCSMQLSREPSPATPMDEGLRGCIASSCHGVAVRPEDVVEMHSSALHDAAPLARVMPAAMLFVPSIGGVSHNFDEHTHAHHIELGARAFVGAAVAAALGQCAVPQKTSTAPDTPPATSSRDEL